MPSKLIASSLALLAFAAAVVAGLIVDNPATTIISRALIAMILCYIAGSAIGAVAQRALEEHVEQYKRAHPLDSEADELAPPAAPAAQPPSMEPPGAQPAKTAGAADRAAPLTPGSPYAPPNEQAAA